MEWGREGVNSKISIWPEVGVEFRVLGFTELINLWIDNSLFIDPACTLAKLRICRTCQGAYFLIILVYYAKKLCKCYILQIHSFMSNDKLL